jgi:guanylate kinase
MDRGLLVIVSGPSGAGKTSIARALERRIPGAAFSVSVTTRPRTPADRPGIDYSFVAGAEFDRMVAAGELLEWAEVFGNRYGTPRKPVDEALAAGKVMILEIDVRGGRQVKERVPRALGILVLPPGDEVLLERLRARGRDDEGAIRRRFAEARREMEEGERSGVYEVRIVNRDLERAIEDSVRAVESARRAARGE